MVIALGPGKFYGSSLPRPRYYTDIKYNTERVDPPLSVLDPLLNWANEAHWSMGGLSFHRVRLQGKIEGNIDRLRSDNEKIIRTKKRESERCGVSISPPNAPMGKKSRRFVKLIDEEEIKELEKVKTRASYGLMRKLPAPILKKRTRLVKLIDEEEEEEIQEVEKCVRPRLVRKLGDEFDRVASEDLSKNVRSGSSEGGLMKSRMMKVAENLSNVASRTRGRISDVDDEDVKSVRLTKGKKKLRKIGEKSLPVVRTSPRLSKNSGSV